MNSMNVLQSISGGKSPRIQTQSVYLNRRIYVLCVTHVQCKLQYYLINLWHADF
jgi:hypothetical protein